MESERGGGIPSDLGDSNSNAGPLMVGLKVPSRQSFLRNGGNLKGVKRVRGYEGDYLRELDMFFSFTVHFVIYVSCAHLSINL
jgi:hypothetical protein